MCRDSGSVADVDVKMSPPHDPFRLADEFVTIGDHIPQFAAENSVAVCTGNYCNRSGVRLLKRSIAEMRS